VHSLLSFFLLLFAPPPTHFYSLSLHDALPISLLVIHAAITLLPDFGAVLEIARHLLVNQGEQSYAPPDRSTPTSRTGHTRKWSRSEEHTSELQSLRHLVCRLLLEKKKKNNTHT